MRTSASGPCPRGPGGPWSSTALVVRCEDLGERGLSERARRALMVWSCRDGDRVGLWMFYRFWGCVDPGRVKGTWSGWTARYGINWPMKVEIEGAVKC